MDLAIVLAILGFQPVKTTQLNSLLRSISCDGSTAFRDAVVQGNKLMLELYELFCKKGDQDQFKFVHVILTDGEDNKSEISQSEFLLLHRLMKETIPSHVLQTFFIGVNLESNSTVRQEMQQIIQQSGNNTSYYPIASNGIKDIFQKIQMQIGIRVQQKGIVIENNEGTIGFMQREYQPVLQMKVNNYIVLFTLDISGSMANNWSKVCDAVNGFLGNLGPNDLVMGITFNDTVKILTQEKAKQNYQAPPKQIQKNVQQKQQAPPKQIHKNTQQNQQASSKQIKKNQVEVNTNSECCFIF